MYIYISLTFPHRPLQKSFKSGSNDKDAVNRPLKKTVSYAPSLYNVMRAYSHT